MHDVSHQPPHVVRTLRPTEKASPRQSWRSSHATVSTVATGGVTREDSGSPTPSQWSGLYPPAVAYSPNGSGLYPPAVAHSPNVDTSMDDGSHQPPHVAMTFRRCASSSAEVTPRQSWRG